jgi:hypothetical protein
VVIAHNSKMRSLLGNTEVKPLLAGLSATVFRTHDFNPRFACLSRLLKDLGGHLESLKLLKLLHNVALKKPAAGGFGGMIPSRYKGSGKPK